MRSKTSERWLEQTKDLWTFERDLVQSFEQSDRSEAGLVMAGVDEVGRGCLAGPVVAAAVVLGRNWQTFIGVRDSKGLSKPRRDALCSVIVDNALAVGVGTASVAEIDEFNILAASRIAMGRAVAKLSLLPHVVLVDGLYAPIFPVQDVACVPVVSGDAKCLSIAAASVVAKVQRDAMMAQLHVDYPAYGFLRNVGYGTPEHLDALRVCGPTPQHRMSFAPVRNAALPG